MSVELAASGVPTPCITASGARAKEGPSLVGSEGLLGYMAFPDLV